jgi:hypothetical protein
MELSFPEGLIREFKVGVACWFWVFSLPRMVAISFRDNYIAYEPNGQKTVNLFTSWTDGF